MIDQLVARIEAIGPGKRVRLATLRRDCRHCAAVLSDPDLFSRSVGEEPRLRALLFRDRNGAWWRRCFSSHEREGAVIDLSNVFWTIAGSKAESIEPVVTMLRSLGIKRVIGVADANLRHLVSGFEQLGVLLDELVVVEGGTPADPEILDRAERDGMIIVSNDRFREWKKSSPWRRRNTERLRVPITIPRTTSGETTGAIDLGLAADELLFDRGCDGRYDTK